MKNTSKKLCVEAEKLGYEHTGVNSSGALIYAHSCGHEVRISPSATENQAREISKAMRKATGHFQAPPKRRAVRVKERQASQRELDAVRLAAERRVIESERQAYLTRIEAAPLLRADPAELRRYEERLRELDRLDREMRAIPARDGRAKHTAGVRAP